MCDHTESVIDEHVGDVICTQCGVVLDRYFIRSFSDKNEVTIRPPDNESNILKDLLTHLHLPLESYYENISKTLNKSQNKRSKMQKVVSEIYKEANKNRSSVSLKELQNLTGLKSKQITSNNVQIVSVENFLEKNYLYFDLTFEDFTLIKELLHSCKNNTGHQPLTIVGGLFYHYLNKQKKKKTSMSKVASILGINPVSIQRFVNNVLSSRS